MESFIASLLERLLATSMQTALLAAMVWLLCRAIPRLSPATQCWLWWLVALQVLAGLFVDPVRLPWLPQAPAAVAITSPADLTLLGAGDLTTLPTVAARSLPLWQIAILLMWLGGLVVMVRSSLRDWRRSTALLASSTPCADAGMLRAVLRAAERRGLRSAPRIHMSREVDSPFIAGCLRPVLVLPAQSSLSANELDMAVDHELEHLRRADMLLGWVPVMARHCFFFHPLVHLAVRDYGIAREAACDAAVVDAGHRSRQEYGHLLVRLGTADHGAGLAAASQTFHALRRRLTLLQQAKFLPRAGSIAVLLLVLAGVLPLRLVASVSKPNAPNVVAIATIDTAIKAPLAIVPEPGVPPGEVKSTRPTRQLRAEAIRVAASAVAPGPVAQGSQAQREPPPASSSADLAQMEAQLAKLRLVYSDRHPDVIALLEKIKAERKAQGMDQPRAADKSGGDDLQGARERLQELRMRYTDKHPEVIAQKQRIEELERQQIPGDR